MLMSRTRRMGALSADGCRLSVRPVLEPKSRMEERRKLKIGKKGDQ